MSDETRAELNPDDLPRMSLEVVAGDDRGRIFPVSAARVNVGRGAHNQVGAWLILSDASVSRLHAVLQWDDAEGTYRLENRSSSTCVTVNGRRAEEGLLRHGDVLGFGGARVRVRAEPRINLRKSATVGVADRDVHRHAGSLSTSSTLRADRIASTPTVKMDRNASQALPLTAALPPAPSGPLRLSRTERAQLLGQLGVMLEAGVTVHSALNSVAEKGASPAMRRVAGMLAHRVTRGDGLAAAMRDTRPAFDDMHVQMVASGVTSGCLTRVLNDLSHWEERDLSLLRAVKGGLIYPVVVMLTGLGLALFLGQYVFASLIPLLTESGRSLPFLTTALIRVTELIRNPWFVGPMILAFGMTLKGLHELYATPAGRLLGDRALARNRVIGPLVSKLFLARFCAHLNLMYAAGVPFARALEGAAGATSNVYLRTQVTDVLRKMLGGASMADAMRDNGHFPALVINMVSVGDESGTLDDVLARLARMYDAEVYDSLRRLATLLEPVMIAAMGVLVGVIVLATLLPLYGMLGD